MLILHVEFPVILTFVYPVHRVPVTVTFRKFYTSHIEMSYLINVFDQFSRRSENQLFCTKYNLMNLSEAVFILMGTLHLILFTNQDGNSDVSICILITLFWDAR